MPGNFNWEEVPVNPFIVKIKVPKQPEPIEMKEMKISKPEYHRELILICGVPGSGKSTLAKYIKAGFENYFTVSTRHVEADHFFIDALGDYNFDPSKLQQAHEWCQAEVKRSLSEGVVKVIVSNTSINKQQREPYIKLAKQYGYSVQTIICRGEFESIHAVPAETIRRMSKAFEY